jgi:hypothetical protein
LTSVSFGDPYASAIANIDGDPQAEAVLAVMKAWHGQHGSAWMTAREALAATDLVVDCTGDGLSSAILAIDPKGLNSQRFGVWLQKHREERISGFYIDALKDRSTKIWRYRVVATDPQARIAPVDRSAPVRLVAPADLSGWPITYGESVAAANSLNADLL